MPTHPARASTRLPLPTHLAWASARPLPSTPRRGLRQGRHRRPVEEPAVGFDAAAVTDAPGVGNGLHVPVAAPAASASTAVSAHPASAAAFAAFAAASVSEAHGPLLQVAESPNLAESSSSESQREPASQSVIVKPGCLPRRLRHTFHTLLGAAAFSQRELRLGRRPNCCRSFSSRHSISLGGARCTCSRVGGGAFARDGHCARSHALMPMP